MSRNHIEKVKCQKCGHEYDYKVWESINSKDSPELKDPVRNQEAFIFHCPKCSNGTVVLYPFFYHEPEKSFLIHFVPEFSQAAINFMQDLDHDPYDESIPLEANCQKRVVFNINQFHEKLLILDEGLDDRAVELLKLFIIAEIMNKDTEHKIEEIYLNKEKDGSLKFAVLFNNSEWGRTEFIRSNYDLIVEKFKVDLLAADDVRINTQWAMEIMNKKI
ncbi:CpXC domain-containing protein [Ruminococcus sp.]|uniref:CpXC domain-containing protein n=1 Tax=Ruminococcus sp. TaxID=41978 RepID=UPI001B615530|nr:CpXC domain-containing protein [Ruminococcus sp.]MBP5431234.1 CpXC domain-containing protein [Ruminococcus sp.]